MNALDRLEAELTLAVGLAVVAALAVVARALVGEVVEPLPPTRRPSKPAAARAPRAPRAPRASRAKPVKIGRPRLTRGVCAHPEGCDRETASSKGTLCAKHLLREKRRSAIATSSPTTSPSTARPPSLAGFDPKPKKTRARKSFMPAAVAERFLPQDTRDDIASRLRVCEACVAPADRRLGPAPLGGKCGRCHETRVPLVVVRGAAKHVPNPHAIKGRTGARPERAPTLCPHGFTRKQLRAGHHVCEGPT